MNPGTGSQHLFNRPTANMGVVVRLLHLSHFSYWRENVTSLFRPRLLQCTRYPNQ